VPRETPNSVARPPLVADRQRLARPDLDHLATASLVAAASVAVLRATDPFDHGIWLVAYLFLVGFLAQLLLGRGQAALLANASLSGPPPAVRKAELVLWNFGVAIVPLGVLVETRLAVVWGTACLLGALYSFWSSARWALAAADEKHAALGRSYRMLLVFMATTAVTGLALAWDIPWL
jgi:hypothetical protein